MTEEELSKLRAAGISPDEQIWVAHYFSHFGASSEERRAFRDALLAAELGVGDGEVGADEEVTGDGNWHVWAFTVVAASEEALRQADTRARDIASRYGVR